MQVSNYSISTIVFILTLLISCSTLQPGDSNFVYTEKPYLDVREINWGIGSRPAGQLPTEIKFSLHTANLPTDQESANKFRFLVVVNNRIVKNIPFKQILKDIPELWNRVQSKTYNTGVYATGTKKVEVIIDPNGHADANHYQKSRTRIINFPNPSGPDLVINGFYKDERNGFILDIKNAGNRDFGRDIIDLTGSRNLVNVPLLVGSGNKMDTDLTILNTKVRIPYLKPGQTVSVFVQNPSKEVVESGHWYWAKLGHEKFSKGDKDTTNNSITVFMTTPNPLVKYSRLLASDNRIMPIIYSMLDNLEVGPIRDIEIRKYLAKKNLLKSLKDTLLKIERGQPIGLDHYPRSRSGTYSQQDGIKIYLARVAQSLWMDANNLVPWKLQDLNTDQLELLIKASNIHKKVPSSGVRGSTKYAPNFEVIGAVTLQNTHDYYHFLLYNNLLRSTKKETIYALTDWFRGHMRHGSLDSGEVNFSTTLQEFGVEGYPSPDISLYAQTEKQENPNKSAPMTWGCHGVSGLYNALLSSVNIPVRSFRQNDIDPGHSRTLFPSEDIALLHGDQVTESIFTPFMMAPLSKDLFVSLAELDQIIPTMTIEQNRAIGLCTMGCQLIDSTCGRVTTAGRLECLMTTPSCKTSNNQPDVDMINLAHEGLNIIFLREYNYFKYTLKKAVDSYADVLTSHALRTSSIHENHYKYRNICNYLNTHPIEVMTPSERAQAVSRLVDWGIKFNVRPGETDRAILIRSAADNMSIRSAEFNRIKIGE